jgi:hypothetical protein
MNLMSPPHKQGESGEPAAPAREERALHVLARQLINS